jgi:hypothetical protein
MVVVSLASSRGERYNGPPAPTENQIDKTEEIGGEIRALPPILIMVDDKSELVSLGV